MELFPLAFLTAAALAWVLNELELISYRRAEDAHWTERARRLLPARVSRQQNIWAVPVLVTLLGQLFYPEVSWIPVAVLGFLGTLAGNYPMDRATNTDLGFREWLHMVLGSWLLQLSGWTAYVVAALLMPARMEWTVWLVAVVFAAVVFGLLYGAGLRLARWIRLLHPASARLQALVDETSVAMNVPVRATWEMIRADAGALAFVTTRELIFSRRLLAACSDDEIKAVCAHELGHLSESRWILIRRVLGSFVFAPLIFIRPAWGEWQEAGAAGLALIVVMAWIANVRLMRSMEKRADQVAHENTEKPAVYARALERIYQLSLLPSVQPKSKFQSHPDLYDRMVAAGVTPDYPRPKAPSTSGWTSVVTIMACVIIGMELFVY